jgi:tetratricopeptide (TPR) repeat protein
MHRGGTGNPEAYQLYLKGRYYAAKFDLDDVRKGFDYFQQAVALDPNYALAYDGMSYYYQLVEDLYLPVSESMPKADEAARKALAIDESIPESHVQLGSNLTMYDFDWAGAEREFRRAIELNPDYAPAHQYYGWLLAALGRTDEALAESRRGEALDPTSFETVSFPPWWLYFAHRYDEAASGYGKCLELDATYIPCLTVLGQTREQQGRFDEAIAEEAKALKSGGPDLGWPLATTARSYALSGRRAQAQQTLDQMLAVSKRGVMSKFSIAAVYAALGDKSRALDYLEQAFAERSFFLDFIRSDPEMDSLRAEPRFQELVRRMNFPR